MTRRIPLLLIILAACGPIVAVTQPPALNNTPGPAIIIAENMIDTEVFQVRRPGGWRVITSAADAPVSLIFVSPDERWLLMISAAAIDVDIAPHPSFDDETEVRSERRDIMLDDEVIISTFGAAPVDEWDEFTADFERTIESLKISE